jgi:hypothetical protein
MSSIGGPIASTYMSPKCGGGGGWVSANEYICAHGAQINFGGLTPYFTYDQKQSNYEIPLKNKF